MHKSLEQYELIGFFVIVMLGTAFHSLFDLCNHSIFIGLFTPINESIWEHLKILFYPYVFYTIFEYYTIGTTYSQFIISKFYAVCIGMLSILITYYTYSGIIGTNYMIIDIIIFIISCAVSFYASYRLLSRPQENRQTKFTGICLFIFMMILFIIFTFYHPSLAIFEAPAKVSVLYLLSLFL